MVTLALTVDLNADLAAQRERRKPIQEIRRLGNIVCTACIALIGNFCLHSMSCSLT